MAQVRKTFQFERGLTVSPSELQPSTTDGEVLQTLAGNVAWGSIPPDPAEFEKAKRFAFFIG